MKSIIAGLLALASLSASQPPQARTFSGVVSDSACEFGGHASMRMGPTDAECATLCVMAHGSLYVLADGRNVYVLSDQQKPEAFAGQKVRVTGTLDEKTRTIRVDSIVADKE